jgi:probable phosphoglycerate mutase
VTTRLLVLRHGESEGNAARILQGHFDSRLSELGREQARVTAEVLASEGIERIITSPLLRAAETATIIGARLGLTPASHSGLLEYDMGAASGKSWDTLRDEFAYIFAALTDGQRPTFPGEEGRPEFAVRVAAALEELAAYEGTSLVVTHGGVIGAMCHIAIGLDYVDGSRFASANCSITEFGSSPQGGLVLYRTNDTCHLDEMETVLDLG